MVGKICLKIVIENGFNLVNLTGFQIIILWIKNVWFANKFRVHKIK